MQSYIFKQVHKKPMTIKYDSDMATKYVINIKMYLNIFFFLPFKIIKLPI